MPCNHNNLQRLAYQKKENGKKRYISTNYKICENCGFIVRSLRL